MSEHHRGGDNLDKPEFQAAIAERVHTNRLGGSLRWDQLLSETVSCEPGYALGLTDSFPVYSREIDEFYHSVGFIAQHDWLFADWGESVLGIRPDQHSEINNLIASPRASLMFDPLDWLRLRTAFSSGFRPPQVFDEDLHITIMGGEGQVIQNALGLTGENAENDEPEKNFGETRIFRTPRFYGYAEAWWLPTEDLKLNTTGNLSGPMLVPHCAGYIENGRVEESPSFFERNTNVSYHVDMNDSMYVRPYVGVRNILNAYQNDLDVGANRDSGYVYGPRTPRTFIFGIEGGI